MSLVNFTASPSPKITVIVQFEWLRAPFVALTDVIAVYWNGSLNSRNYSLSCWKAPNLVKMEHDKNPSVDINKRYYINVDYYTKKFAGAGVTYNMDIKFVNAFIAGEAVFELYDTVPRTGKTIEVTSQYLHQTVKGGGVTISYPPGVNVGTGYDESEQRSLYTTI